MAPYGGGVHAKAYGLEGEGAELEGGHLEFRETGINIPVDAAERVGGLLERAPARLGPHEVDLVERRAATIQHLADGGHDVVEVGLDGGRVHVGLAAEELVVLDRPAVVHAALLVPRQVHALLHEGLGRRLVLEREGRLDRVEALRRRLLTGRLLEVLEAVPDRPGACLLYTSPSPRDATLSRMPSSA